MFLFLFLVLISDDFSPGETQNYKNRSKRNFSPLLANFLVMVPTSDLQTDILEIDIAHMDMDNQNFRDGKSILPYFLLAQPLK